MSAELFSSLLGWGVAVLAALIIIAFLFYWFYRRSTKEMAFVRTGFGGQKAVINGGALVFPIFHDVTPVNMRTQRFEIRRDRERAMITKRSQTTSAP